MSDPNAFPFLSAARDPNAPKMTPEEREQYLARKVTRAYQQRDQAQQELARLRAELRALITELDALHPEYPGLIVYKKIAMRLQAILDPDPDTE